MTQNQETCSYAIDYRIAELLHEEIRETRIREIGPSIMHMFHMATP